MTTSPAPPWWRGALVLALMIAVLVTLPYVRGLPPRLGAGLGTLLVLLVSLLVISELARQPLRPLTDALALVVCLGLWYAVGLLPEKLPTLKPLLMALASVSFLVACSFAGRLLALIVRERNLLLPVALVAGLADIFTVFAGPTGEALKHAPKLVEKLSVAIPKLGSATGAAGGAGLTHVASAGLGDFIFVTFFLVSCARFGLRGGRSMWWIFGLAGLAMMSVLLLPFVPALPLLPFIAAGFLLANLGVFRLSREERLSTIAVVALLIVLLVAALLLKHR